MVKKLALFSLFFVIIGFHLFFFNINNQNYYWDEAVFLHLAEKVKDGTYASELGESYRPPLFPFILSFFPLHANHLILFFLVVLSFLSVFLLGKELYNTETGLIAAIILSTIPLYFFYSFKLLAEPLLLSLLSLTFFFFSKYQRTKRQWFLALSSFFLGLSILTKYQALIAVLVFVPFSFLWKKQSWKDTLLALTILLLTLSPLVILGITYYGTPWGMITTNLFEKTTATGTFWYYFEQLPITIGLFITTFFIYSLFSEKYPKPILIFFLLYALFILLLSQKYDRFLIPLLPFLSLIAARGVYRIEQKAKYVGIVLLIGWVIVSLPSGIHAIQEDKDNTKLLIETAKTVNLVGHGMATSPVYFSYFGNLSVENFPKDMQDISKIDFFIIDTYHPRTDRAYLFYINYIREQRHLIAQFDNRTKVIEIYA